MLKIIIAGSMLLTYSVLFIVLQQRRSYKMNRLWELFQFFSCLVYVIILVEEYDIFDHTLVQQEKVGLMRVVVRSLVRWAWILVVCLVVGWLGGQQLVNVLPPTYQATAVVHLDTQARASSAGTPVVQSVA